MRIGPFNVRDAQAIEHLFDEHQIEYTLDADENMKNASMQEFHENIRQRTTFAIGSLELRHIFFDVEDQDFPKVSKELERFGIA